MEKITLEELAFLIANVEEDYAGASAETLRKVVRGTPELAALHERLAAMAADAGCDLGIPGWERDALLAHRAFERLLAENGRREPGEVLAGGGAEVDAEPLLAICRARRERGELAAERAEALERRLREAARGEAARRDRLRALRARGAAEDEPVH